MLFRIEASQHVRTQKSLNAITPLCALVAERHIRTRRQRRVLQGAMNLRLYEYRFIFVGPSAGGQEVKLMAGSRRPMSGAVAAGVDPQCDAIRLPRSSRIADREVLFPLHFYGQPEPQLIPA